MKNSKGTEDDDTHICFQTQGFGSDCKATQVSKFLQYPQIYSLLIKSFNFPILILGHAEKF